MEVQNSMKSAIVLAAGKGTRMKSSLNKVMHTVLNKPMIGHIVDRLEEAGVDKIVVVVGHSAESIKDYLKDRVSYVVQEEQLGTGHAVMQAKELEGLEGDTIVLCGDGPCIQTETIQKAFEANANHDLTVLTAVLDDGLHYGRIVRGLNNEIEKIVEAKDCNEEQKTIREINTGVFCFKTDALFEGLKAIKNDNAQNEYYLTDLVEIFHNNKKSVHAVIVEDKDELMGVNDRLDLAKAQKWLQTYVNEKHMRNGVTLMDPDSIYIDTEVEISEDSIIYPNVRLEQATKIGKGVTITSNSVLINAVIEDGVQIDSSRITDSKIGKGTTFGPMSHARMHTNIGENCRIGNFVEFKNTNFGNGSKCAHLTYIGDSDFGEKINVGCGVVTVNYDGKNKYRTTVHDGAFIGSNCNLIAPVTIGENALLAAGSTITGDVEAGDMGIARVRQSNKSGYGTKYKNK